MDKAQEKIAQILHGLDKTYFSVGAFRLEDESIFVQRSYMKSAKHIIATLEGLGYHKLPEGKPPIKTDDLVSFAEELQGNAQFINSDLIAQIQHIMWESRKAQRDSDIKWMRDNEALWMS